jgi:hypothetical protein
MVAREVGDWHNAYVDGPAIVMARRGTPILS